MPLCTVCTDSPAEGYLEGSPERLLCRDCYNIEVKMYNDVAYDKMPERHRKFFVTNVYKTLYLNALYSDALNRRLVPFSFYFRLASETNDNASKATITCVVRRAGVNLDAISIVLDPGRGFVTPNGSTNTLAELIQMLGLSAYFALRLPVHEYPPNPDEYNRMYGAPV